MENYHKLYNKCYVHMYGNEVEEEKNISGA
jgi:hypothetical protein